MTRISWICILFLLYAATASAAELPAVPAIEQATPPATEYPLSTATRIVAKRFIFTGNDVIPTKDLEAATAPYIGRTLTIEQLEEMRQVVNRLYLQRGYVTSGVTIPYQMVRDGDIYLTVIEGNMPAIDISGLRYYRNTFLAAKLGSTPSTVLNVNDLQERLQLLQQDPRILRINAELKPGEKLGEAKLSVKVEELSPYTMTLRFHDDAAPGSGIYKGEISLAHRNLLGFGDALSIDLGVTEGALDYGAGYTVPLTADDTTLALYYRKNNDSVVEEQFSGLDIRSDSETMGLKLRRPVHHLLSGEAALSLTGEYRQSHSRLLGRDFSFSPGEHDGIERISVIRFGQEYVQRDNRSLLAVSSTVNFGMPLLGATRNHDAPDSRFVSWLGQLVSIIRVGESPAQVMFRTSAQLAACDLLPLEKFGLGGMTSVRGYRTNILVRDNGVNSSLELRLPLLKSERGAGTVQFIPFFDFGWGWNTNAATPKPDTIESVGAGIRWSFKERYLLEAYYGYGIEKIRIDNKSLADQGIHFQLTAEVF